MKDYEMSNAERQMHFDDIEGFDYEKTKGSQVSITDHMPEIIKEAEA